MAASAIAAHSAANTAADPNPGRLRQLKAQARKPGEASFFWYERQFRCEAVKGWPGEYFVANEAIIIMRTLGSCVAVCLWDRKSRIGGLNHFMLPDGVGDSSRYGAYIGRIFKVIEITNKNKLDELKAFHPI